VAVVRDPLCTRCALHVGVSTVCVGGDGPPSAPIMLVGEAPGATEDREGIPFIGAAGQLLNRALTEAGLHRSAVYITNVAKCRPPMNRTPIKSEIEACRVYLMREIEEVSPRVIVALGGAAAQALTGKAKISDSRGKVKALLPCYRSSTPVYVTYHPAAALYESEDTSQRKRALVNDLIVARRSTERTTAIQVLVDDENTLLALSKAKYLTCDCEWETVPGKVKGMWPWSRRQGRQPTLVSVAVAGVIDGKPLAVAIRADNAPLMELLGRILTRVPTVYHNAPADLVWLLAQGVEPRLGGDTLLLASLLNIEGSLSLETLTATLTDYNVVGWKADTSDDVGQRPVMAEAWDRLLERNGIDALSTLYLHEVLIRRAAERKILPLYKHLLRATMPLCHAALSGTPLDEVKLTAMAKAASHKLKELRTEIAQVLGVPSFASGAQRSTEAVAATLEAALHIRFPRTTTGRPSIKRAVLADYVGHHPAVALLMQLSALKKLETTYLRPWTWLLKEQGDGLLHTQYRLWVARTGRSSAEVEAGGTLQQFPSASRVRSLVTAREGWVILSADLSQIELRIAAWIANEMVMIQAFRDGGDLHRLTASHVRGCAEAEVTKADRQAGKATNFGLLYGQREEGFVRTAKAQYGVALTIEEATVLRRQYFNLYPALEAWHRRSWEWVKLGYVNTPFGRTRPLIVTASEDENGLHRKAINTPVQATASDIALIGMAQAYKRLRGADWVVWRGFVHDAVILEVREDKVAIAEAVIRESMEHPPLETLGIELPLPLVVDIKKGADWGVAV
jgi:uracil-DNA glycosylase family 4